jgi:benzoate/toluate 1,2-dioxygenase reductase component
MKTGLPERAPYTSRITRRQWLTGDVFTLGLARPPAFAFTAGQRVRLHLQGEERDYSLIPGPHPDELELLIRSIAEGIVSSYLSCCPLETPLDFSGPGGHFIYRPSPRQAVFVATGTGIAPFAAMCRCGVQGFIMLHGVRDADDLYYRALVESAAIRFIPCLTGPLASAPSSGAFPGRVTQYLRTQLPPSAYDFYLAGRREMIADAMAVVDEHFPTARVYTEIFF